MYRMFKELTIGATFVMNGNLCRKRSTRTADLLEHGIWAYYGSTDKVWEV